ncbi:MAG TPA: hypothetical protein VFB38_18880 [Chthonomonadaceae bacterium]|nr:hypothetical protein [Chthonomonadaceae bacterium]
MQTERGKTRSIFHRSGLIRGMLLLAVMAAVSIFPTQGNAQELLQQTIWHSNSRIFSFSLNDNGWAVWDTRNGGSPSDRQVYLWDGHSVTSLGLGRDPRINNNNWVVWSNDDNVLLWQGGGSPQTISGDIGGITPVINNHNQIAWTAIDELGNEDIYFLPDSHGTAVNFTGGGTNEEPRISDNGFLTWELTELADEGTDNEHLITNIVGASIDDPTSLFQITNRDDQNVLNGGINNSATKVVWAEYNDDKQRWDIWQADANGATDLTENLDINGRNFSFEDPNQDDPMVNDDGTVVWYAHYFDSQNNPREDLYWELGSDPSLIPVFQPFLRNSPVAINNTGGLIFASGNGNVTGFDVILVVPEPGALAAAGALLTGLVGLRWRRRMAAKR